MNQIEIIAKIENIWNNRLEIAKHNDQKRQALEFLKYVKHLLNIGKQRACSKIDGVWKVSAHIKKAILSLFYLAENEVFDIDSFKSYDKIGLRFGKDTVKKDFESLGVRVVFGACVRNGVFLGKNVVVMPSFINIGAYIDDGSMIDSMTTIGSCAQIGKSCHISSGVTIAGVLEPMSARPVIIEDDCFIGSGSQISEGIIVGKGSVIGSGVILTGSTKIYDTIEDKIIYGFVPPGSVLVPGFIHSDNKASTLAAIIIKKVDDSTRDKTSINEILRMHNE